MATDYAIVNPDDAEDGLRRLRRARRVLTRGALTMRFGDDVLEVPLARKGYSVEAVMA